MIDSIRSTTPLRGRLPALTMALSLLALGLVAAGAAVPAGSIELSALSGANGPAPAAGTVVSSTIYLPLIAVLAAPTPTPTDVPTATDLPTATDQPTATASPCPTLTPNPTASPTGTIPPTQPPPPLTNLLPNGTFESGNFTGWQSSGGATIITSDRHGGTYAAQLANTSIRTSFATTPGKTYKVTGWVHITSEGSCSGCWGGMRFAVYDASWTQIGGAGPLLTATNGSAWFKIAFTFVATQSSTPMDVGYFGDSGRSMTVVIDDLMAFAKPAIDTLPNLSQISLSPTTITSLPQNQTFSVVADDPDGAIAHIEWDFGDGMRALTASGTRRVGLAGAYTAIVKVTDDDAGMVVGTVSWTAAGAGSPSVSIASPATDNLTVNTSSITLSGTTGGGVSGVQVSSDRGGLQTATGTAAWSVVMPLQPGNNRLLVQAAAANGQMATAERLVRYVPSGSLAVTNLVAPASVERWEPLSITFTVNNSAATDPQFPYGLTLPPGLQWVDGASVDGLFTPDNWVTVYRRPAFLYQPYQRADKSNEEWLYPQGPATWAVRFAPPSLGNWKYHITVTEARGTTQSADGSFTVTTPSNALNHGPVQVAPADSRYFQLADGTPFLGSGYNTGYSNTLFSYDAEQQFAAMGSNNENFFRLWLGGDLWGSAWEPWASRSLGNDGYLPATGLTLDRAYGNGLASLRLDDANPVMTYGCNSGHPGLISGHTYRIRVRWRTEGVTGPATAGKPYGGTIKLTGWLNNPQSDTMTYPSIVGYANGDTPWHVSEGTFVASGDYPMANGMEGYVTIARENATGGAVYVDEIGLYEDLGNGNLGPELLRDPNFNTIFAFDDHRAAGLDAILTAADTQGKYLKLVISEKDEFLINHFASDGLPDANGGYFDAGPGAPTNWLDQAYWRYLSARYGAYRSVQSWELVNEDAPGPGPHFQLTAQLATFAGADGNPHLASTSTWATLAQSAWKAPYSAPISYTDFHAYVRSTGWLTPAETLANDSALFFNSYDLAALAANFGKPVIWGEMGIDGHNGSNTEDPDIIRDTAGVWLHKIIWARCGPGGVYPLYWYTTDIWTNNLHSLYGAWQAFMANIPFTNGHYQDVAATSSNGNMRVFGQRDLSAKQAYFWIDNSQDTWRNVVNGTSIPSVSGTVKINLQQPNGTYTLTWYDTKTGGATGTVNLTADGSGVVTVSVTNLQTDEAAKLAPR